MVPGLKEFYFRYQEYYIAAWTYNSIYFFLYIRCAGIVFLSIHRYLVISVPHHSITMKIQEASTWQIVIVYWVVPTLISIVVLKDTDFHYDALETMEVVAPRPVITVGVCTSKNSEKIILAQYSDGTDNCCDDLFGLCGFLFSFMEVFEETYCWNLKVSF